MDENVSFGDWLRRRRKALDLTQEDLARRVGCATGTIKKIEADARRPSREIAALLASHLQIAPEEREDFIRCARAELSADRLPPQQQSTSRTAFGPTNQVALPDPQTVAQPVLPSGMVTFLFTDIEGSTPLWERESDQMRLALAHHDAILRTAIVRHSGHSYKVIGDAFQAAFALPAQAVAAALAAQYALAAQSWETSAPLRVRMGLHVGPAVADGKDYTTTHTLNRVARIMAAGHGGQILLSVEVADIVRRDLPIAVTLRDMGKQRMKGLMHPEHLFQIVAPDLPDLFPPLKTLDTLRTNLPILLTSFIGREQAIDDIKQLLAAQRLTTLTGPGGTGKTRLALQVASEALGRFSDGVWLVELAPLADPALVPHAAATALGLREQAGRPILATLTDFLGARKLLLILDNCEHLVEACAQLTVALLRACPNVHILASSREALGVAGEAPFRVPSLRTPDPRALPPIETLTEYEAVQLFVERAAAVLPGFTLTNDNAPALAHVCGRLDGIPLAIELAAARVNVLRVEQIADRLNDRFRLLTGGSRTAVPRQQTLRASIDWSYDLLVEAEQVLLRRLSVFAGGWTLEAAEAVCGDWELGVGSWGAVPTPSSQLLAPVLDVLTQLINKSLVMADREQGQETRYRLLETIRQYALERLAASGEADVVRQRHAAQFLALAEKLEPHVRGAEQGSWLARLEQEHDNLRAALAWALGGGAPMLGMRLAVAQAWFWWTRGYWSEGRAWLEAALAVAPNMEERTGAWDVARATALRWAGMFAGDQGDYVRAMALLGEAQALCRALTDQHGLAETLWIVGGNARIQGDYARATALLQEALTLYRELGDQPRIADTLHYLGNVAREQGDYVRATALFQEALSLHRELGDRGVMGADLIGLGELALYQGDLTRAAGLCQEAQALFLAAGFEAASTTTVLRVQGWVAYAQGDFAEAVALLEEAVARSRQMSEGNLAATLHLLGAAVYAKGDAERANALLHKGLALQQQQGLRPSIAESLERFALLAAGQGQPGRAARLLGAAQALRAAIDGPLPPVARPDYDRTIATIRAQLNETTFATVWAAGQALSLEQAIEEALHH